jgi:hypothetical protein
VRPSWYFNLFTCSNLEETVILKSIFLNVGIHTFIGTHKERFGGKVILMTSISYCSSFPVFSRTGGFNFTPGNMGESINFEIERWKNYNFCLTNFYTTQQKSLHYDIKTVLTLTREFQNKRNKLWELQILKLTAHFFRLFQNELHTAFQGLSGQKDAIRAICECYFAFFHHYFVWTELIRYFKKFDCVLFKHNPATGNNNE